MIYGWTFKEYYYDTEEILIKTKPNKLLESDQFRRFAAKLAAQHSVGSKKKGDKKWFVTS